MGTIGVVVKAYLTRGLVSLTLAVLLTALLATAWVTRLGREWGGWGQGDLLDAYAIYAVTIQILMTASAGFVAATALELMWDERMRLTPRARRGHAAVLSALFPLLIAACVGLAARAGFAAVPISGGTIDLLALATAAAGIGVWTVSAGALWWAPTIFFFIALCTKAADARLPGGMHVLEIEGLVGLLALVAWFFRVFCGRPGGVPWDLRILGSFTEWIEVLWNAGPLRGLAPRIAERVRRNTRAWRVTRWWAGATSGNEWLPLLFAAMMTYLAYLLGRTNQPQLAQGILMGVATMAVMIAMGATGERSRRIEYESVRPVRRADMLRQIGTLILCQVGTVWAVTMIGMTIALGLTGWGGMGPAATFGWAAWTGALAMSTLAVAWWVHRYPSSAIAGVFLAVAWLCAGWGVARAGWTMAGAAGIWTVTLLQAAVGIAIMRDAYRRWLVTDLSDPDGGRRLSAKLERAA